MVSKELLLDIARCPNVSRCLQGSDSHPCQSIIVSQEAPNLSEFQVPEPWSGQLSTAPVLFLSSNPSISDQELYPRWSWTDEEIVEYFNCRFGKWIQGGKRSLQQDGTYSRAVAFWSSVRRRAEELYQRDVRPGVDYALSEVVHCKSKQEIGVPEALEECAGRYLHRVLDASGASIIVVLGSRAQEVVLGTFPEVSDEPVVGPIRMGERDRYVTFLPHPNARQVRTFPKVLSEEKLELLRLVLRDRFGPCD